MSLQGVTGSRATVGVVASLHAVGLALLALGVADVDTVEIVGGRAARNGSRA